MSARNSWISAAVPPSTPRLVLASDMEFVLTAVYEGGRWQCPVTEDEFASVITHWMELPPLPEADGDALILSMDTPLSALTSEQVVHLQMGLWNNFAVGLDTTDPGETEPRQFVLDHYDGDWRHVLPPNATVRDAWSQAQRVDDGYVAGVTAEEGGPS